MGNPKQPWIYPSKKGTNMERITNDKGKFRHFKMTEDEYSLLTSEYMGLCISCGAERDSCEPDATEYECECCEKKTVYGAEELMLMERIKLTV
jgi:hypothetical protein